MAVLGKTDINGNLNVNGSINSSSFVKSGESDPSNKVLMADGTAKPKGDLAGFGDPTASASGLSSSSSPTVSIETSGTNAAKIFNFKFGIPKGMQGETGPSLDFTWNSTKDKLGVKKPSESTYTYSNSLKGPEGPEGPAGPAGPAGPKGATFKDEGGVLYITPN